MKLCQQSFCTQWQCLRFSRGKQIDKYKFTHVLTKLVRRGFVEAYDFEIRDVYLKKRKHYYATTKGQLLYLQTTIDIAI
jgi:hypothetical protein